MTTILLSLLLLTEPASVSMDQLAEGSMVRSDPIEQVTLGKDSAYVEGNSSATADRGGDDVAQLSVADNEIALSRVEGIDRCSAELLSAIDADYCRQRIETRSAEFRSDLSASFSLEQKLVSERLAPLGGIDNASRMIGANASAKDGDVQALASITFVPDTPISEDPAGSRPGDLSTETQALIEAIVSRLANPGGN